MQVPWLLVIGLCERRYPRSTCGQRIGDLLNRVALRHDEFIIERKGKPLAALVPVERLEQMRRFARRHGLDVLTQQEGGDLTEEQAMELALEAQAWTRKHVRKPRRRTS